MTQDKALFGCLKKRSYRIGTKPFIEVIVSQDLLSGPKNETNQKEDSQEKEKDENSANHLFSSFIREYGPFKKPLLNIVGLSLLGFVFGVISPRFAQAILDEALSLRDMPMLISMAVGLIIMICLNSMLSLGTGWLQTEITSKYDLRIGNAFFEKLLRYQKSFLPSKKSERYFH